MTNLSAMKCGTTRSLTRNEILMLSPRRLDALIAEKLEGLPVVWAPDPFRVPDRRLTDHHPWLNGAMNGRIYNWDPVKRYSANWDLMKLVIKAMRSRGWWCQLRSPYSTGELDDDSKSYHASFRPHNCLASFKYFDPGMPGEDAPLAVSRAAIWVLEEASRLGQMFTVEDVLITNSHFDC